MFQRHRYLLAVLAPLMLGFTQPATAIHRSGQILETPPFKAGSTSCRVKPWALARPGSMHERVETRRWMGHDVLSGLKSEASWPGARPCSLRWTSLASPHGSSLAAAPDALPSRVGVASLQLIAAVGGEPDDLAVDAHGRLVWGDLANGTIERLDGAHITVLARGLSVPEGVVPLPNGGLVVAEQGHDTITRLDARSQRTTALYHLAAVAGQEGVDGIGRDPRTGDLLIPDSPHGVVLRVSADGRRVRVIARGLGRPVDAATDRRGDVLVPDEHLNALVVIAPNGRLSYRRNLSIPDDVAVDRHGNVWVTTLGDGGLWLIAPGTAPRRVLVGLANPQGLALDRCGNPIIVQSNIAHIDRLLLNGSPSNCPF